MIVNGVLLARYAAEDTHWVIAFIGLAETAAGGALLIWAGFPLSAAPRPVACRDTRGAPDLRPARGRAQHVLHRRQPGAGPARNRRLLSPCHLPTSPRRPSVSIDALCAAAEDRTGLPTSATASYIEGLALVSAALASDRVSPQGRSLLAGEAVTYLSNRLRVDDFHQQHHQLVDSAVESPIVILGLPRTGTTLLSYLLDLDPQWRSLLNWEAVDSVPPPTTATLRSDPRCLERLAFQEQVLPIIDPPPPHWEWGGRPNRVHLPARRRLPLGDVGHTRAKPRLLGVHQWLRHGTRLPLPPAGPAGAPIRGARPLGAEDASPRLLHRRAARGLPGCPDRLGASRSRQGSGLVPGPSSASRTGCRWASRTSTGSGRPTRRASPTTSAARTPHSRAGTSTTCSTPTSLPIPSPRFGGCTDGRLQSSTPVARRRCTTGSPPTRFGSPRKRPYSLADWDLTTADLDPLFAEYARTHDITSES